MSDLTPALPSPLGNASLPSTLAALIPLWGALSDGLQIFDSEGRLIYANAVAAELLGYATAHAYREEHYRSGAWGLTAIALANGANRPLEIADYPCVRALKSQPFAQQTLRYTDWHGRDRCVAVQALSIPEPTSADPTGQRQYAVVISRSVTEPLIASSPCPPPLQQIANAVPSLVAYLDAQEQHCFANHAYLKAFDETLDNIQGQSLQTVVGPVIYHQLQSALHQAWQGKTVNVCLPIGSFNPKKQYKHVSLTPQWLGEQLAGVYLVLSDITAHKHTNDLLQTETNFFRDSLEAATVGIWDWHFLNQEMMWSSPQEQLFGLKPGGFDGKPDTYLALVHAADRADLHTAIDQAMQPQNHFAAQFRVTLADQSVRWLSQRGQVVRNAKGQIIRMAGVTFDITVQKEAEEKLIEQAKRDHLVAKISEEINRSTNLNEVLPQVVQDIRCLLQVDRLSIIDLLQPKMAGKVTFEAHTAGTESMLTWEMRHPWAMKEAYLQKYQQGHPIAVCNVNEQSFSEEELEFLGFFQITAELTVPLLEDKKLWGLLSAQSKQPRTWQPEERRLLETLGRLVSTAVQRDQLHHSLTQANQKLQRFAYLDGLTQVANRRRFEQFLNHEWRRLMREKSTLALIMVDIDHFKAFNDIYGHQAGDECLRRVAAILRTTVQRPADMVARYGGEEFVVVLPNTGVEGAETVAEKIRAHMHEQKIPHRGSQVCPFVTMSLGVAVMSPHPLKAPDDLIKIADKALYQAKENGRDRVVCHTPTS
ncbi:MAG: diguanylate cyclase, partial [Cyanobacteria bacterium P01_A01_bin.70]